MQKIALFKKVFHVTLIDTEQFIIYSIRKFIGGSMKAFGITGNIGCGKSSVLKILNEYLDILIIDCDKVSKTLIGCGAYTDEINTILGFDAFPNGDADFKLIAKTIFTDITKLKAIEELMHPKVWQHVESIVANESRICVVESAIIFEKNVQDRFEYGVIVVDCSEKEQFRRLWENRQMNDEKVKAVLALQLPAIEKLLKADYVIDTTLGMEETTRQSRELYLQLKRKVRGKKT